MQAWLSRVSAEAQESEERLAADGNLANGMLFNGNHAEAEPMLRGLHRRNMRMFGVENPNTLTRARARVAAGNLAESLSRYADTPTMKETSGTCFERGSECLG